MKQPFSILRPFWECFGAVVIIVASLLCEHREAKAGGAPTNQPPAIHITNPCADFAYTYPGTMRLEAVASDPGGFVASVRFLDGTNLLGTVTNTPFRLVLTKYLRGSVLGTHFVTAVATDDRGAETTSAPVRFFVVEQPGPPYLAVLSPRTGAFYIEPANVSIEVFLTTSDDSTPVEVLLGTNVVGTLPQCPFTMVLSNVLTGSYSISARQNGILGTGYSQPVMITVARLLIAPSQLSTNGQFSFDVQTAITNQPTVIETSRDLSAWQPVFTNSVVTNAFHYADVMRADAQPRFFRAVIHQ